jgi:hypothetical protein
MGIDIVKKRIATIEAWEESLAVTLSDGTGAGVRTVRTRYPAVARELLLDTDPEVVYVDLRLPVSVGETMIRTIGESRSCKRLVLRPFERARRSGDRLRKGRA